MSTWFADAFFFFALVNNTDGAHAKAVTAVRQFDHLVTTPWVLTEVADGLCQRHRRGTFLGRLAFLKGHEQVTVVPADQALFDVGVRFYADRPDKDWSLTNCISFAVMREHGITAALTGDHHFEQAGFTALLA